MIGSSLGISNYWLYKEADRCRAIRGSRTGSLVFKNRDEILDAIQAWISRNKLELLIGFHPCLEESYESKFLVLTKKNLVLFEVYAVSMNVTVLSEDAVVTKEQVHDVLAAFETHKRIDQDTDDEIWIQSAYWNGTCPYFEQKKIKAPWWKAIKQNYPSVPGFDALVQNENPSESGKLIILNGAPGTGKTYAIRSLLMEWRKRYLPFLISDPEEFCERSSYYFGLSRNFIMPDDQNDSDKVLRRPLVIFEDAAILLMREERAINSKMIGKLLNMTDGILGQGMEAVFLITFNEQLEKIDPAFTRPGRCISALTFKPFSREQANVWLKNRGLSIQVSGEKTLAELYELAAKAKTS